MTAIRHADEPAANAAREAVAKTEPRSLRTFTPTQAVIAESAGVFHWTPDGRRLYDFTSGVLVSNLGHNPTRWLQHFCRHMGWPPGGHVGEYSPAVPMTAYNAVTPVEAEANRRLLKVLHRAPGSSRLESVMWAASGSEAVQKALWAAAAVDKERPLILATRHGFHGKKGLAAAVTGHEGDPDRDPRVHFLLFPMAECADVTARGQPFDPREYRKELEAMWCVFGPKIGALITEPYLGGGGSYHPPKEYLQLLERFCRERDIVFILDEVQSNFGRTGKMFAFEKYEVSPDIVVLGKGLGNGVPVAAAVGRKDVFDALSYGEASDTWSANPLSAAAVLATLDEFEAHDVLGRMAEPSRIIEDGLLKLKRCLFVANVRGEEGGMVWGVEMRDHAGRSAAEWANALVLSAYRGDGRDGVHLLGPLAKKVVRVAPPLTITADEATHAMTLLDYAAGRLAGEGVPEQHA